MSSPSDRAGGMETRGGGCLRVNVASGGNIMVPVTVLSQYNFSGSVVLSCTAPSVLYCMVTTNALTSSPAGASKTVFIETVTTRANLEKSKPMGRKGWGLTAVPAFAGLLLLCMPKRRRFHSLVCGLLGCTVLIRISGCFSSVPPLPNEQKPASAGNYTVIVTGISSSGTHNLPITVTVH